MYDSISWSCGPGRLTVSQGDLTRVAADAIVNAANSGLLGGGGVDGAIHRAAGPELLEACKAIVAAQGQLPTGKAVITPGFNLPARHVIHTVGPVWRGDGEDEPKQLASAYNQSLQLAARHDLAYVAFPLISCGVYGYPLELAAPVALGELRQGLEQGLVRRVDMIIHSSETFSRWLGLATEVLGPGDTRQI